MPITTAEVIPLTAAGTLAVSVLSQRFAVPLQRKQEQRAEAAEERRAVRARGRLAAEAIASATSVIEQSYSASPFLVPPTESDLTRSVRTIREHLLYFPDRELRQEIEDLLTVVEAGGQIEVMGGPVEYWAGKTAFIEIREAIGHWSRNEPRDTKPDRWSWRISRDSLTALDRLMATYRALEEEADELAVHDGD